LILYIIEVGELAVYFPTTNSTSILKDYMLAVIGAEMPDATISLIEKAKTFSVVQYEKDRNRLVETTQEMHSWKE
jgi:hypothetical protein